MLIASWANHWTPVSRLIGTQSSPVYSETLKWWKDSYGILIISSHIIVAMHITPSGVFLCTRFYSDFHQILEIFYYWAVCKNMYPFSVAKKTTFLHQVTSLQYFWWNFRLRALKVFFPRHTGLAVPVFWSSAHVWKPDWHILVLQKFQIWSLEKWILICSCLTSWYFMELHTTAKEYSCGCPTPWIVSPLKLLTS